MLTRLALILASLVAIAFLVNRFAPTKRKRVGRTVTMFAFYAIALGLSFALTKVGATHWGEQLGFVATLFEALTIVNLGTLVLFDLGFPAARLNVASIIADLVVGVGYIVVSIGMLRRAGMDFSSVVTTSAIVSGVLALSLQATLGNILGGIALQLDGSIHAGDWITLTDGRSGKVQEIHWRHTVVQTRDWDTIIVPNSTLLQSNIVILGKRDGMPVQHRMWVYFNVDFRYSPRRVISVVESALRSAPIERVATNPPPNVICYDFAKDGRDSFAYYAVRYWLTDLAIDDPTSSAVRERVYAALRRASIPLARPSNTTLYAPDDSVDPDAQVARHHARRLEAVGRLELFKSLTEDEREYIADHLVRAPFALGEIVTKQGAVAHWLYILVSGTVEIRAHSSDGEGTKHVTTLEGPSFFGEMGLMTGEPRSADVIAVTEVECYRLDKEGFQTIIKNRPEIAAQMSKMLARRRVELARIREGLDADQAREREASEATRILGSIREFFGLDEDKT